MKPLADVVEPGADFFVEEVAITAIVFNSDDDDATVWATSVFDQELHFFNLALSFADLSTLLRLAGERGPELDEEVADALASDRPANPEEPTLLEFITDDRPPVALPAVALKLAFTFMDEEEEETAHNIFSLGGIYLHING